MPSVEGDVAPPFHQSSIEDNHAAWVVAMSLIFLVLSILVVGGKIGYRYRLTGLKLYDGLNLVATGCATAETVCIIYACKRGMGRHREDFDDSSFEEFSKFFYSAQILAVASMAFAKSSVSCFLIALTLKRKLILLCYGIIVLVALSAITGIVPLATQCQRPTPWLSRPGKCVNQHALHVYITAGNVFTDLALIIVPIFVIWYIQTSTKVRLQVIAHFSLRIIVPIFAIIELLSLSSMLSNPADPTWYAVTPSLWLQVMLGTSILTACIPSLKPVLDAFRSGAGGLAITTAYELSTPGEDSRGQCGSGLGYLKSTSNSRRIGKRLGELGALSSRADAKESVVDGNRASTDKLALSKPEMGCGQGNAERSESITGLKDNMIIQTAAYEVDSNDRNQRRDANFDGGSAHSDSSRDTVFEDMTLDI